VTSWYQSFRFIGVVRHKPVKQPPKHANGYLGQAGQKTKVKEHCFGKGPVEGSASRGVDLGDRAGYAQLLYSYFHGFRYVFMLV